MMVSFGLATSGSTRMVTGLTGSIGSKFFVGVGSTFVSSGNLGVVTGNFGVMTGFVSMKVDFTSFKSGLSEVPSTEVFVVLRQFGGFGSGVGMGTTSGSLGGGSALVGAVFG